MKDSLLFSVYGSTFKGYLLVNNILLTMLTLFLWFKITPITNEGIMVGIVLTIINIYGWLSIIFLSDYNPEFNDLGDRE